jgi:hypothetical protein
MSCIVLLIDTFSIHNESAISDVDLGSDDLEDYAPELNVSMRSTALLRVLQQ